jgi:hypothetical protein
VKVAVPGSCRRLKTWALDLHGRVLSQLGYGLRVEAGRPFVREVFPELAAELVALLEENGERELAVCAAFALSPAAVAVTTSARASVPKPAPRVLTAPAAGASLFFLRRAMLNLDVVNGRIMYAGVIGRPPLRNGRRDEPGNP